MFIVVQHLVTRWTQATRGAKYATLRNRAPEALPLLGLPTKKCAPITALYRKEHLPKYQREAAPPPMATRACEVKDRMNFDCVEVLVEAQHIVVTYAGQRGAPVRFFYPVQMTLQAGNWARIRYNSRFSGEAGWSYEKTVLNIGVFEDVARNSFLGDPTRTLSDMAQLWW